MEEESIQGLESRIADFLDDENVYVMDVSDVKQTYFNRKAVG